MKRGISVTFTLIELATFVLVLLAIGAAMVH